MKTKLCDLPKQDKTLRGKCSILLQGPYSQAHPQHKRAVQGHNQSYMMEGFPYDPKRVALSGEFIPQPICYFLLRYTAVNFREPCSNWDGGI